MFIVSSAGYAPKYFRTIDEARKYTIMLHNMTFLLEYDSKDSTMSSTIYNSDGDCVICESHLTCPFTTEHFEIHDGGKKSVLNLNKDGSVTETWDRR